jgi:hypothetical protein
MFKRAALFIFHLDLNGFKSFVQTGMKIFCEILVACKKFTSVLK